MHHVAIMNKQWKLIDKILKGKKTIESRWYKSKTAPWNRIKKGETVYFKDSGAAITAKAKVAKVLQFEDLNPAKIKELISTYGSDGKIAFSSEHRAFEWAKDKKYCILIFLKKPESVKPYPIDKKGFGNASAWLCVEDIYKIKLV